MERMRFGEWLAGGVRLFDGAMGTSLQKLGLRAEDFAGHEGVNEVLVRTRPEAVASVHRAYLEAGADVIETNSFGALDSLLAEAGLAGEGRALAREAAALARETAQPFGALVAGSLGPGTKLPSLGHIAPADMAADYRAAASGLLEGGADLLLIETCQDPLQIKTAILAARAAMRELGTECPIVVTATLETTGHLLVGTDLAALVTLLAALKVEALGLNCAFGPLEMERHIRELAALSPLPLLVQPNAGLPRREDGHTVYPLGADEFGTYLARLQHELGLEMLGGCCGTTPDHIRALRAALHPGPRRTLPALAPALSSLYAAQPLHQTPRPLLIGERLNANGSKRFKACLSAEDEEGALALASEQEAQGAHALDLCVAMVGRDEPRDLVRYVSRLRSAARVPLCLDSTRLDALQAALPLLGARPLINSVNLEDGPDKARRLFALAAEHGAALVALAIDERGMARTAAHKLEAAERLLELAREAGLGEADLLLDMLTFSIAAADEHSPRAARETLDAIRAYHAAHPQGLTVLGVSNVSYGLPATVRPAVNSVFLTLAVEAGLSAALVDAAKIRPLAALPEPLVAAARRLLVGEGGADDMNALLSLAPQTQADEPAEVSDLPARIRRHILLGQKAGLDTLIAAALTRFDAQTVLQDMLIAAMQDVGRRFGAGQLPLPFVLQAAETMRVGVAQLEDALTAGRAAAAGTLVLATVKGDVHDIGKNLVDIIVRGNGFHVHNLGIKISAHEMLDAYRRTHADAIGMSGLLVKSTEIMRENLHAFLEAGERPPVILGGAALDRAFVEGELRAFYGPVYYAEDAFEGLAILRKIVAQKADVPAPAAVLQTPTVAATPVRAPREPRVLEPVPAAPFWGVQTRALPLDELLAGIIPARLFAVRWQYKRGQLSADAYASLLTHEAEPALAALTGSARGLFAPQARVGFAPVYREGDTLVVLDPVSRLEILRVPTPRGASALADAVHDSPDAGDALGLFVVTMGPGLSAETARLYAAGAWRDYLHLHGLGVELAEVGAEWVHTALRREWGLGAKSGLRASFGYPACPDLALQAPLLDWLGAQEIGVSLTSGFQMQPEQSVSALVFARKP